MTENVPSLQRFVTSLEKRLRTMSAKEIRAALLAHANTLPGAQRSAFLAIFTDAPDTSGDTKPADTAWPVEDDPLLDEIDAFVAHLASGAYVDGFGWDHEIHDERSFGDESWVWEMDALFASAQDAFLGGQLSLARAAYQRLLAAFGLDEEMGAFCGPEPPVEMVTTDVPEAESRYLRAIYETTPPEERAIVLHEEWFTLPTWRPVPALSTVREARREDLPELDQFLPRWISQLRANGGKNPEARRLLTEATQLYGGVDGLAALAREAGPDQTELYLDWVQALRGADRDSEAAAAAREALDTVEPRGQTRARIAEHLAELLRDDAAELLAARVAAWRAAPTEARLLTLHHAASAVGDVGEVHQTLATEIDALEDAGESGRLPAALRAAILLLAGREDHATRLLRPSPDDGQRPPASRVLVPYLLAAGCAGPRRSAWASTRLADLLVGVDQSDPWRWSDFDVPDCSSPTTDDAPPPLSALLTEQIAAEVDDPTRRSQRLQTALAEVGRQVDAILTAKARRQYASAARLLACCAEAVTLEEGTEAGTVFLERWRDRYPRHVAFRRELDQARAETPLLTDPATRRSR
jgi:hypothetical protein